MECTVNALAFPEYARGVRVSNVLQTLLLLMWAGHCFAGRVLPTVPICHPVSVS